MWQALRTYNSRSLTGFAGPTPARSALTSITRTLWKSLRIGKGEKMVTPPQVQPGQQIAVPKIVYVVFTALIDPKTTQGLLAVMANCATQGVKSVYLALSTPG